ncbi:MAG: ATP-binding protein [Methylocystis sp.]|jgi:hypothetical protein
MSEKKPKGIKEQFAKFFEDPSRESLRTLLKDNLGETEHLDFKKAWPRYPALAKHILGFANTGHGCLIIGVEEKDCSLEPVGIEEIVDKADIQNGLKNFLPSELITRVNVFDFPFKASEYGALVGKLFQVILVEFSVDHTPFVSPKDGDGIRAAAIYVRREGITAEATHDELQRILNRRIEAGYSTSEELDLKKHIEQLRILYSEIPSHVISSDILAGFGSDALSFLKRPNPQSPKETLIEFLRLAIEAKKHLIAKEIGVSDYLGKRFPH